MGTDALIVAITAIYTSYDLRGSLLGGRAAGIGAREILLHATSGIDVDRVKSAIERMGFEAVGGKLCGKAGVKCTWVAVDGTNFGFHKYAS